MDSLPQPGARNYTPHLYQTRLHSCKRIRESHWEVRKVLSYYRVKRSSVYRLLKLFNWFAGGLGEQKGAGGKDEELQLDVQDGAGERSSDQVEFAKLRELLLTTGEIRCPKLGRRLTSSDS